MVSLGLMVFLVLVAYIFGLVTIPLLVYMRLVKPARLRPIVQTNQRREM